MSFIAKNPLSLPEINYTPSTPSGTRGLFPKSDGWYSIDKDGVEKKLLDLDDMKGLERLQYYGDANIIPTDESYFEIGNTEYGTTIYLKQEYRYNDILTEVVIPYKSDTEIIKAISDGGFESFGHKIKKIILPNTIVSIGSGAFNNCVDLIDVNIPNSVTEICSYAFYGCSSLTQLILPDSILRIGDDAFDNCSSDLTIICSQGSVADTYAKENRIKVKYDVIDADSLNNSSGGTGAVSSVNGQVGEVVLSAEDVGAYTKEEINSKLSSVYRYKGTIDYYFELPQSPEVGDVYNIRYASGANYTKTDVTHSAYTFLDTTYDWFIEEGVEAFGFMLPFGYPPEFLNNEKVKIGIYSPSMNEEYREMGSFELPVLDGMPNPLTSGIYWEEGYLHAYVLKSEAPFSDSDHTGSYATLFDKLYDYLKNHMWMPNEKPHLQFNNEAQYSVAQPYFVNVGDNVAWTGTEWDILGGTEDMSLYAQTDLSNVDNATFKAKAESAGVGGGSGNIEDYEIDYSLIEFDTSEIAPWEPMRHLTLTDMATDSKYDLYVENGKLSMEVIE